jgi:3-oxoacyl-[acyl-carrier protein] reductase
MSAPPLEDQVALVTGASRGIGYAIAHSLGAAGAVVIGTATTAEGADKISQALKAQRAPGIGLPLDVDQPRSIEGLLKLAGAQYGPVTILVNNAGVVRDNLLLRMKDEEWYSVLNTNLNAAYHLCKACLRGMMRARHGRIINITSVVGLAGNAGQSNYAASKAGLIGFSKSLAREIGARGVTVNTVAPGFIDTDMTRNLTHQERELLLQQIPLGRPGSPADVAQAVLFLASPAAAYITGHTLSVNGGMLMS